VKVWVIENDGCLVCAYRDEQMAIAHATALGLSHQEVEVRDDLHPDALNPELLENERLRKEQAVASHNQYREHCENSERMAQAMRPSERMQLCCCATFSDDRSFITAHGYCKYCGGFEHVVFREVLGEDRLQRAIDTLESHRRDAMRQICAGLRKPGLQLGDGKYVVTVPIHHPDTLG
jgi:hypothetical protein